MSRRIAVANDTCLDKVLDDYLGKRKVANREETMEPFSVFDPLERLQGEAIQLATFALSKTARKNGIVSGVDLELDRFLDIKTASRGFSKKSEHLVSAKLLYLFHSDLLKSRGLDPLHLKVSVSEGVELLPHKFEEGYEFSPVGIQEYCDSKAATYDTTRPFLFKSAQTGKLILLGRYDNPHPIRKEFQRRGMSISSAMDNKNGLSYVVMGPDRDLPVARLVCESVGIVPDSKVPKHHKPSVKDALDIDQLECTEEKDAEHPRNIRLEDTFKRSVKLEPGPSIELTPGDIEMEDDRIRQLVGQRRLVEQWLANGGGSWYALVEDCEEQFEDATWAPMSLQQIIWDLSQAQPVWAMDPQGEPFRVRRGCDVTGSDKIWIEHETAVGNESEEQHETIEHEAMTSEAQSIVESGRPGQMKHFGEEGTAVVAPKEPSEPSPTAPNPVEGYLLSYIKKQGSTSDPKQHPRWAQLVAAVQKDKSLGQPLTDEYLGRQVRAYLS